MSVTAHQTSVTDLLSVIFLNSPFSCILMGVLISNDVWYPRIVTVNQYLHTLNYQISVALIAYKRVTYFAYPNDQLLFH